MLFFVLLEAGLRLFHYGTDLSLFVREEMGGKSYLVMNPDVKSRYFTHVEFSPNTSHDYFQMPKPAGTYRIFCLGGSTTVGFPYGSPGSFSTFLRQRLSAIFPDRRIESINLGMTATNSYTTLDIARELPDYDPDLVIVYDGHNEFYGALGAASHESVGSSRTLTLLYLRLNQLKTFALVRSAIASIRSLAGGAPAEARHGTMMEQLAENENVAFGSPLYVTCRRNFAANVVATVSILKEHGIPVILSTQASNLRGQPPFVSRNAAGPTGDYEQMFQRAVALVHASQFDSAGSVLRGLISRDSLRADVHYQFALVLDSLHRASDAAREYTLARDFDELRFRMSSDFNAVVRAAGDPPLVCIADVESTFAAHSHESIIGNELILEHLHPNLDGEFLMARTYADVMRRNGLLAGPEHWARADAATDSGIAARSVMTLLDSAAASQRIATLTSRWPFTRRVLVPTRPLPGFLRPVLAPLLEGKRTWEEAHVGAAEAYIAARDTPAAEREYRAITDQLPHNVSAYLFLGQLHMKRHELREASAILRRSLEEEETVFAYRTLGSIQLDSGRTAAAVSYLERARELSTEPRERISTGYLLALAYKRNSDPANARREIEAVLALNPGYKPALRLRQELSAPDAPSK